MAFLFGVIFAMLIFCVLVTLFTKLNHPVIGWVVAITFSVLFILSFLTGEGEELNDTHIALLGYVVGAILSLGIIPALTKPKPSEQQRSRK